MEKKPKVHVSGKIPEDVKRMMQARATQLDRSLSYVMTKVLRKGTKGGLYWIK